MMQLANGGGAEAEAEEAAAEEAEDLSITRSRNIDLIIETPEKTSAKS